MDRWWNEVECGTIYNNWVIIIIQITIYDINLASKITSTFSTEYFENPGYPVHQSFSVYLY